MIWRNAMNNRLHLSSTLATAVLFLALVGAGGSVSLAQVPLGPTPLVPPPGQQEVIRDQFIVELKPGVARDAFIQAHGFVPLFRYILINGFAARKRGTNPCAWMKASRATPGLSSTM